MASGAIADAVRSDDAPAMCEAMAVKLAKRLDATRSAHEKAALSRELREVRKALAVV